MEQSGSGYEVILNEDDLRSFDKQAFPIVVAYNGHNHFLPTVIMSPKQHNEWKCDVMAKMLHAALQVKREVNPDLCSETEKKHLASLDTELNLAVGVFAKTPLPTPAAPARRARAGAAPVSGPIFPLAPGTSFRPDAPSTAPRKKGKDYVCDKCAKVCKKKQQLTEHLWNIHKEGTGFFCTHKDCVKIYGPEGKSFKSKRNMV